MKNRLFCLFLIITLIFSFTACGNVKGEYTQLSAPFSTDETTSQNTSSDSGSSSETVSSDTASKPEPTVTVVCKADELVRVSDYIPDVKVDIKYATADNFTKGKIYDFDDAYVRYGTVLKLKKAADALREKGYRLVIWDAYRPQSAQFTLFENSPDPTYVSDPNKGFSSHSSGGTVDITVIKADGSAVEMPTDFDDFSDKANRNYDDVSETAGKNSKMLEDIMKEAGFKGYSAEWWHYSDTDSYDYDDIKNLKPASRSKKVYLADCEEYISLRKEPSTDSEVVCKGPANAELMPYCWIGKFIGVTYGEYKGYVSASFVK